MSEVFEANGEYILMRNRFGIEASKSLRAIRLLSSTSFTEDFRRAVSIYHFLLELDRNDGKMRAFAQDGMEEIKLNRAPYGATAFQDGDEPAIGVVINLNDEILGALAEFEMEEGRALNDILDSIIIQYANIVERSFMGEQFLVESKDGKFSELVLLNEF